MCTAHVLMRFCHLIDRSFVCKVKEGRHIRINHTCSEREGWAHKTSLAPPLFFLSKCLYQTRKVIANVFVC